MRLGCPGMGIRHNNPAMTRSECTRRSPRGEVKSTIRCSVPDIRTKHTAPCPYCAESLTPQIFCWQLFGQLRAAWREREAVVRPPAGNLRTDFARQFARPIVDDVRCTPYTRHHKRCILAVHISSIERDERQDDDDCQEPAHQPAPCARCSRQFGRASAPTMPHRSLPVING